MNHKEVDVNKIKSIVDAASQVKPWVNRFGELLGTIEYHGVRYITSTDDSDKSYHLRSIAKAIKDSNLSAKEVGAFLIAVKDDELKAIVDLIQ